MWNLISKWILFLRFFHIYEWITIEQHQRENACFQAPHSCHPLIKARSSKTTRTILLKLSDIVIIIIIIIIIKKDWQCKAGRGRLTPYQSEDPSPTLATYRRKEEKGKIVEAKKGESNQANNKALDLLLKPANQT